MCKKFVRCFLLVVCLLACSGCAVSNYLSERARRQYVEANPEDPFNEAILDGRVKIGMNAEQVRASWGPPKDVFRHLNAVSTRETYHYPERRVHFLDGKVVSMSAF